MPDQRSLAASLLAVALTTALPLSSHAQTAQSQLSASGGSDASQAHAQQSAAGTEYPPVTELVTHEQLRATLQLLLSRGLITQQDYDNALQGKGPIPSAAPAPQPSASPAPPSKPP